MKTRLLLHEELCSILGSNHVYFQPPESVKMVYPAIRYKRTGADSKAADDINYINTPMYEIIVIDRDPDSELPAKLLLHFPMCKTGKSYMSDNLYHYPFTLYY